MLRSCEIASGTIPIGTTISSPYLPISAQTIYKPLPESFSLQIRV